MELVKLPVPVPLTVLLPETVGVDEVLQQTPLAVTEEPPSDETVPPDTAVVEATELTAAVVTEARPGVVKVC